MNPHFSFALSFAVIANYWTIHHDIFRPVRRHDARLIGLNMLWLAAIVFLPFPTALIAAASTAALPPSTCVSLFWPTAGISCLLLLFPAEVIARRMSRRAAPARLE